MPEYSLAFVLPYARATLAVIGNFTFQTFIANMWTELAKAGVVHKDPSIHAQLTGSFRYDDTSLNRAAIEAWCYMQRRGFIIPRSSNFPSLVLDHINFERSPSGEEWSKGGDALPEDPKRYIEATKKVAPATDDVVMQYLTEGVRSFEIEHHYAAAVMLGAAAEKSLYMLAETLLISINASDRKTKLKKAFEYRDLKNLRDLITGIVTSAAKVNGAPYDVFGGSEQQLLALYQTIQFQRNDAVHPMIAKVSEDSLRLAYQAFPHALSKLESIRTWFSANPNAV